MYESQKSMEAQRGEALMTMKYCPRCKGNSNCKVLKSVSGEMQSIQISGPVMTDTRQLKLSTYNRTLECIDCFNMFETCEIEKSQLSLILLDLQQFQGIRKPLDEYLDESMKQLKREDERLDGIGSALYGVGWRGMGHWKYEKPDEDE